MISKKTFAIVITTRRLAQQQLLGGAEKCYMSGTAHMWPIFLVCYITLTTEMIVFHVIAKYAFIRIFSGTHCSNGCRQKDIVECKALPPFPVNDWITMLIT